MFQKKFTEAAWAAGISTALFQVCPDVFGNTILDSAKRLARFLEKKLPDIGHRKMLEAVATAAGFPNWHAFQTLATKLTEDYAPPTHGSRHAVRGSLFEPFTLSVPLLIQIGDDLPPTPGELSCLEGFGERLSAKLDMSHSAVMDVLSQLQGADTLSKLKDRKPVNSVVPLYRFVSYGEGDGRFDESNACWALVDELDKLWQQYEDLTVKEQHRARKFVEDTLDARPDFLEGMLALATMDLLDGHEEKAGPIYEAAIKQADALIPAGFKGKIDWGYTENRFYHRLLYNYMRWCGEHGQMKKAIQLARKQLQLNPHDNLGVRFDLPALLAANGEHDSADVAIRKFRTEDNDAHPMLVMSICYLAAGDLALGRELFLRALFDLPALRPLILENEVPNMRDEKWHRGITPDFTTLWFDYNLVYVSQPKVELFIKQMLLHPAVKTAEKQLADSYRENIDRLRSSTSPSISMEPWRNECKRVAKNLTAIW